MNFNCPQHQCVDCEQKTSDAGGMLFRCRWCQNGYCEDCLDWDKTELIGENLKEFELLGFPSVTQAFYICCPACKDHHAQHDGSREFCEKMAEEYDTRYKEGLNQQVLVAAAAEVARKATLPSSRAESLTDGTTLDDSGISTPLFGISEQIASSSSRKRKAAPEMFFSTPSKQSKRATV